MANNMLYSLVVLREDGEEIESVVPSPWIQNKTDHYPSGLHVNTTGIVLHLRHIGLNITS